MLKMKPMIDFIPKSSEHWDSTPGRANRFDFPASLGEAFPPGTSSIPFTTITQCTQSMPPLPCCTHERGKNFQMFTQGYSARPRCRRGLGPPHARRPPAGPAPLPRACAVLFLLLVLARPMAQPAAQPQVPGSLAEAASGGGGQRAAVPARFRTHTARSAYR